MIIIFSITSRYQNVLEMHLPAPLSLLLVPMPLPPGHWWPHLALSVPEPAGKLNISHIKLYGHPFKAAITLGTLKPTFSSFVSQMIV